MARCDVRQMLPSQFGMSWAMKNMALLRYFKSTTGWWFQHVSTPLKHMKVSWDDDIPQHMESHNPAMFQSTNQYIDLLSPIEID